MDDRERRSQALRGAIQKVRGVDLKKAAELGSFSYEESGDDIRLIIPSFGRCIEIYLPEVDFVIPEEIDSFALRILALRYVQKADGSGVTGDWISYRQLPGGRFYADTIAPTIEEPLARAYGKRPRALSEIAPRYGGVRTDYGDESFAFHPFPRVPLLVIVYWEDEEFPPGAQLLFDRCCSAYLNTDDLKVMGSQLASMLIKALGENYRSEDFFLWMVD